jgi:DNA-binding winged helix-turn-helix (wHTH) protein/tetratricopeptide (TPR) repeat protein
MDSAPPVSRAIHFGPFRLDLQTGELHKNGRIIRLPPQPAKLLALLSSRAGELVTQEQIREHLWDQDAFVDFEKGIAFCLGQIRGALSDNAERPRFVETLPRRGYRFIARVEADGRPAPVTAAAGAVPAAVTRPRKTVWLALAALGLMASGVALFLWKPWQPRLAFGERDWVLIAQFENRTGEPVFDGALEYALERELSNSQFVNVAPRERIEDALRLMQQPPETVVTAALGREVCLRDGGIRALLTGRVEKLDSTYLLSVALLEPGTGVVVASLVEEALGEREVVAALRRLVRRVRRSLGESARLIEQNEKNLEKVTTPSLRALQFYTQGQRLAQELDLRSAAGDLYRRAVAADPGFASAHLLLAHTYLFEGKADLATAHFQKAFALADTASDRERYHILGNFYAHSAEDFPRAIEAFETLLALYPDDYFGTLDLSHVYRVEGKLDKAARLMERRARLRPNDFMANVWAAMALTIWEKNHERAKPCLVRARRLIPRVLELGARSNDFVPWVLLFPAYQHWLGGDVSRASSEVARLRHAVQSSPAKYPDITGAHLGSFFLTLGRFGAAREAFETLPQSVLRESHLARLAYEAGDRKAAGAHALRSGSREIHILARAGLFPQAEKALASRQERRTPEHIFKWLRGELALARGQTENAISLLEESILGLRTAGGDDLLLALESLASAHARRGDLPRAVQALEQASAEKSRLYLPTKTGYHWLRVRAQLARHYRQLGRVSDAAALEAELASYLALADAGHPLLAQLSRPQQQVGALAQP